MNIKRERLVERERELAGKIEAIEQQRGRLRADMSAADKEHAALTKEYADISGQLSRYPEHPSVSDHALVRFLERKYGFDADAIRAEIMTPAVETAIKFGSESIKAHGGKLKVKNGVIATYIGGDM